VSLQHQVSSCNSEEALQSRDVQSEGRNNAHSMKCVQLAREILQPVLNHVHKNGNQHMSGTLMWGTCDIGVNFQPVHGAMQTFQLE
jgi:hypothetical protein